MPEEEAGYRLRCEQVPVDEILASFEPADPDPVDIAPDLDVVGAAEPVAEIRPCLIGGFHDKNVIAPPYANHKILNTGAVVSVDMVRVKLTLSNGTFEQLRERAERLPLEIAGHWTAKIRPGGWHELYTYVCGESTVTLGIGHFTQGCKLDTHKAFAEFNPNKVMTDPGFKYFRDMIAEAAWRADLARFDLAMDVPVQRNFVRVRKDRRMYKCVISGGMTEYLGQENCGGYTKVYDKAAELGQPGQPLTRIELTCDGKWGVDKIAQNWPTVYGWKVPEPEPTEDGEQVEPQPKKRKRTKTGSNKTMRVLAMLIAEKISAGECVETYMNALDYRARAKLREACEDAHIELPREAAEWAVREALRIAQSCGMRTHDYAGVLGEADGEICEIDAEWLRMMGIQDGGSEDGGEVDA